MDLGEIIQLNNNTLKEISELTNISQEQILDSAINIIPFCNKTTLTSKYKSQKYN